MGTLQGGRNSHKTLRQRLGPEGYKQHMAAIGAKGGKRKVAKGFSVTRAKAPYAHEVHKRLQKSSREMQDEDNQAQ